VQFLKPFKGQKLKVKVAKPPKAQDEIMELMNGW